MNNNFYDHNNIITSIACKEPELIMDEINMMMNIEY